MNSTGPLGACEQARVHNFLFGTKGLMPSCNQDVNDRLLKYALALYEASKNAHLFFFFFFFQCC